MEYFRRRSQDMVTKGDALDGRSAAIYTPGTHLVFETPILTENSSFLDETYFGMGCFWGAERLFWQIDGVVSTAVGYAGGFTRNPTYEEVCSGLTGHAEVVRVTSDPIQTSFLSLMKAFLENHDPTQYMGQGNDLGTQYRSVVLCSTHVQFQLANDVIRDYAVALGRAGFGKIVTSVEMLDKFYFAEDYHQQYLYRNPNGYCNHGYNGVACQIGLGAES